MKTKKKSENIKKEINLPSKALPVTAPDVEVLGPKDLVTYGFDGTSVVEVSYMQNIQYAPEIITDAQKSFDLNKLNKLKDRKKVKVFLEEAQNQILKQCDAVESIVMHTGMFVVHFLFNMGQILIEVESVLQKKSEYTKWIRENFDTCDMRYFQQAKQIAKIGSEALELASIGKNRLIEFDRLKKAENRKSIKEILDQYPFPDTTRDMGGEIQKEHIDAIITLSRLKNAGIDFADFDHAVLIASYKHHSLEIKEAEKIKKWLEQFPEEKRRNFFDYIVMDKMVYHSIDSNPVSVSQISLNKIFADLISYCNGINFSNNKTASEYIAKIDEGIFREAYKHIEEISAMLANSFPKVEKSPRKKVTK